MASIDSSLAESMKAQVLTMRTSASSASAVISMPWARTPPNMTSASTRFLAQPRLIMPTFFLAAGTVGEAAAGMKEVDEGWMGKNLGRFDRLKADRVERRKRNA